MNKFTKISAAALLTLFLAACDKPVTNATAEAPKAEQTAQPAQAAAVAADPQGVEDFKKLLEWNKSQEQALGNLHEELQQRIVTGEKAKIEEGFKLLVAKIDEVSKSLDGLEVKNAEVSAFKEKIKQNFSLSKDLAASYVTSMVNPTDENQKLVQEKSQVIIKAGQELQMMQNQLQSKFVPAAK